MGFWRFLILAFATSVIACTSSTNSGPSQNRFNDGTSDSGGGNGAGDRAYEAYIVRPEQLPAYKALIEPKITKILNLSPGGAAVALPILQRWLFYKTWYVAPVSLDTISKDVIGVSFSSDQTQQLALQTKKSIWIDSSKFQRMDMQNQAALIVHEMVMSLYYLRYKSWEDICSEKIYPGIQCKPGESDVLNEMFPGSTPKPFDSDDYENIRSVTGILLEEFKFQSAQEIDDFLIAHKFDRRFTFGLGLSGGLNSRQNVIIDNAAKISDEEFTNVMTMAKTLNKWPDQCRGVRFKDPVDCLFQFNMEKRRVSGFDMPVMAITVQSLNPAVPLQFTVTRMPTGTIEGSSLEFVQQKKKLFYITFNPDPWPTPLIPGTSFRSVTLILGQDLQAMNTPYTLLGIQSTPGVVTGNHPQIPGECTYAKPSAKSLMDDVVLSYSQYLEDFDKSMLAIRASSFPPFTTCKPF